MTPFMGVRISWLMLARNWVRARMACSAASWAWRSCSSRALASVVRVTDTTYENAFDRALEGEGTLESNRLAITLVPKNGETDYSAEVLFLFGEDGETFCVEFDDSNGDTGPMGTYRGRRVTR